MDAQSATRFSIVTAASPGAIGIIQLHGANGQRIVEALTGRTPQPTCRLVDFADIDQGLVVKLRDDWCQLMPHGGPRVMQRLAQKLCELGAEPATDEPAQQLYPEAATPLEAQMLAALARAASPAAIDLLLDQPQRWRTAIENDEINAAAIAETSTRLDHLIDPPTVALVGEANVGKSTLSNLVLGRAASITADLPGTTRDWVAGLAELAAPIGGLAVRWLDTPGLRPTDDPIERRAIELAQRVIRGADLIIAVREPAGDWPQPDSLPREADIYLLNKVDLLSDPRMIDSHVIGICALDGRGMDRLAEAVAASLGLDRVDDRAPWAFCPALKALAAGADVAALRQWVFGR